MLKRSLKRILSQLPQHPTICLPLRQSASREAPDWRGKWAHCIDSTYIQCLQDIPCMSYNIKLMRITLSKRYHSIAGHTYFVAYKHTYEVYVLVQIDLHIYAIHRFRYLYLALAFIEHQSSKHTFYTDRDSNIIMNEHFL